MPCLKKHSANQIQFAFKVLLINAAYLIPDCLLQCIFLFYIGNIKRHLQQGAAGEADPPLHPKLTYFSQFALHLFLTVSPLALECQMHPE